MNRSLAMLIAPLLLTSAVAAATGYNALGSIASPSFQEGGTTGMPSAAVVPAATGSDPDIQFYQTALAGGEREVALSRLAINQSGNAEVQSLARSIVGDHTAMDEELAVTAHLPEPPLSAADNSTLSSMRKMSGALFDRTYLDALVRDHERAISLFRTASLNAQSGTARNLATTDLPKLQQHLIAAQQLQKEMTDK